MKTRNSRDKEEKDANKSTVDASLIGSRRSKQSSRRAKTKSKPSAPDETSIEAISQKVEDSPSSERTESEKYTDMEEDEAHSSSPLTAPSYRSAASPHEDIDNNKGSTKVSSKAKKSHNRNDSSPPPPIREIHTTPQKMRTRTKSTANAISNDHTSSNKNTRHSGDRWSKQLDEETLRKAKNYLTSFRGDEMDEDDVRQFAIRMQRLANQQARQQISFVTGVKMNDTSDLSDAGSDDTSVFQDCLADEEMHAVGLELYRNMVATFEPPPDPKVKGKSTANKGSVKKANIDLSYDKKTLLWVKRAAGLHRSKKTGIYKDKGGLGFTRVMTRRRATEAKVEKRDRGLDILGDSILELEVEFGPFGTQGEGAQVRKTRRTKKKSLRAQEADQLEIRKEEARQRRKQGKETIREMKRKRKRDLQEKKQQENDTRRATRLAKKRRTSLSSMSHSVETPKKKLCTCLRKLDTFWRDHVKEPKHMERPSETVDGYYLRKNIVLHPQLVEAGVVHALPTMDSLVQTNDNPHQIACRVYDPPNLRHSSAQCAEFCDRLLNCLNGQARLFATCEFFYSDLDREWYNDNSFAADATTKLGISPETKLSPCEWRVVRRLLRDKPRRFSKNFIMSQLSERNEYRSTVRKLQNDPHLAALEQFSKIVHAPIQAGTTVSAYNKRFRIVQRGKVLTFDQKTSLYLVDFENKLFGYELCPDSDVATCGVPEVLISPLHTEERPSQPEARQRSSTGPAPGTSYLPDVKATTVLRNVFSATSQHKQQGTSSPSTEKKILHHTEKNQHLVEDVANRDSFLTLLEVTDSARLRKRNILTAMKELQEIVAGESQDVSRLSSPEVYADINWLKKNLQRTNHVIQTAMAYLQALYGQGSLGKGESLRSADSLPAYSLDYFHPATASDGIPSLSLAWTETLLATSKAVTKTLVSATNGSDKDESSTIDTPGSSTLLGKISAAGELSFSTSFLSHVGRKAVGKQCCLALEASVEKLTDFEQPKYISTPSIYTEVLDGRAGAATSLREALQLLKSELAFLDINRSAFH